MLIDDMQMTLTRAQLVMLQNILDYQLEGLAQADRLQAAANELAAQSEEESVVGDEKDEQKASKQGITR